MVLENVVQELHVFSACERLSLQPYICVHCATKTTLVQCLAQHNQLSTSA